MSDAFESEVMEDLFYESAEGPARPRYGDEFEEFDALEEGFEDGFEEEFEDGFEEMEDLGEEYAYEEMDPLEAMEDAVADALEEEDTDEFLGE